MHTSHPDRIRRYSQLIRAGVVLIALLLAVAVVYFMYAVTEAPDMLIDWAHKTLLPADAPVRLTPAVCLVLGVIGAVNLTLIANGLLSIWRLCRHLDRGNVFAPAIGRHLREAGFYALASAVSQFISNILVVIALTINNPDGQKQLVIGISSEMAFLVVVSGLLMVMGHIMVIASQIDAENKEFI